MTLYSILDSIPNPWNWRFLAIAVAVSVLAVIAACVRAAADSTVAGVVVLVLSAATVIGGQKFAGPALHSLAASRFVRLCVAPLLLGLPPLVAAILMGRPGAGGYPAVLAVLLGLVVLTTRDIEHRAMAESGGREDFPVHTVYHRTLAWVSTVFFFFGVTTLWPWLGQIYDGGYFWILVLGVLMPVLYLWGRLRQPRGQNSLEALIRFNRTLPYLGIILLIAILIG
ncbi:MAG TPA: hypothetical protein VGL38_02750 [bacterium]|jgi:hypothetical protein